MNKAATAVGTAGLGLILLWSGVTNAGVLSTAQSLFMGQKPIPGQPQSFPKPSGLASGASLITGNTTPTPGGGGNGTGSAIADAAMKYVGYPYVWGGRDPSGWDCYGFLTYVLHHDMGYNLPNNTYMGYLEFLSWGQKYQIDESQVQAGDIVIWPTHTGIAINHTEMISAENPSAGTKVATFREGGPLTPEPMSFYRVKGALTA